MPTSSDEPPEKTKPRLNRRLTRLAAFCFALGAILVSLSAYSTPPAGGHHPRPTVTVTKTVPAPGPTVTDSPRPTVTVTELVPVASNGSSGPDYGVSIGTLIGGVGSFGAGIGALLAVFLARRKQPEPSSSAAGNAGGNS